jgi:hypothetical protein
MATTNTIVHVVFKPAALMGGQFQVVFRVPGIVLDPNDTNIQLIISAINSCTRAVAIEISLSTIKENTGSPTASATYVNEDKGFFPALDAHGESHNYKVPSIKSTLLNSDKETINISSGAGAALVTAITTYAKTAGNDAISTVPRAYRKENRKRLKSGTLIVT